MKRWEVQAEGPAGVEAEGEDQSTIAVKVSPGLPSSTSRCQPLGWALIRVTSDVAPYVATTIVIPFFPG